MSSSSPKREEKPDERVAQSRSIRSAVVRGRGRLDDGVAARRGRVARPQGGSRERRGPGPRGGRRGGPARPRGARDGAGWRSPAQPVGRGPALRRGHALRQSQRLLAPGARGQRRRRQREPGPPAPHPPRPHHPSPAPPPPSPHPPPNPPPAPPPPPPTP